MNSLWNFVVVQRIFKIQFLKIFEYNVSIILHFEIYTILNAKYEINMLGIIDCELMY